LDIRRQKGSGSVPFKTPPAEGADMLELLQAGVQPNVISAAGALVTLGGLALTVGWLACLYR